MLAVHLKWTAAHGSLMKKNLSPGGLSLILVTISFSPLSLHSATTGRSEAVTDERTEEGNGDTVGTLTGARAH
jgi:hypothetical protein